MAPEQWRNEATNLSDLYSCGLLLAAMLGSKPQVPNRPPDLPTELAANRGLVAFYSRTTEHNPEARFESGDEMRQVLKDIGTGPEDQTLIGTGPEDQTLVGTGPVDPTLVSQWERILQSLRTTIGQVETDIWFTKIVPLYRKDSTLFLELKNRYYRDWINDNYLPEWTAAAAEEFGEEVHFEFTDPGELLGGAAQVEPVPATLRQPLASDATAPQHEPASPVAPIQQPTRRVVWIDDDNALVEAMARMNQEPVVGLDVETTLHSRTLCLVQVAGAEVIYLIDVLEISDLEPLAKLLANHEVPKVIHNASFEQSVFRQHGIEIHAVIDTLKLSRQQRGKQPDGHSLKAVCARELGIALDTEQKVSDWSRRPLTARQAAYAALDAEVLLALHNRFRH